MVQVDVDFVADFELALGFFGWHARVPMSALMRNSLDPGKIGRLRHEEIAARRECVRESRCTPPFQKVTLAERLPSTSRAQ
jgi:hypothetical protein